MRRNAQSSFQNCLHRSGGHEIVVTEDCIRQREQLEQFLRGVVAGSCSDTVDDRGVRQLSGAKRKSTFG